MTEQKKDPWEGRRLSNEELQAELTLNPYSEKAVLCAEILALRKGGDALYEASEAHDCRAYHEDPPIEYRPGKKVRAGGGIYCTAFEEWTNPRTMFDPEKYEKAKRDNEAFEQAWKDHVSKG